ncbi:MAG: signal peptidase I [Actinomycetota bacterium]
MPEEETTKDPRSAASAPTETISSPGSTAPRPDPAGSDDDSTTVMEKPAPDATAPSDEGTETTPKPRKPRKPKKQRSLLARITELPMLILLAFVIAVLIKTFLVQAFYIPSGSMFPTLKVGDRVLVQKVQYAIGGPRRGDVVVFARDVFGPEEDEDESTFDDVRNFFRELLGLPTGREEDYIKRVVGVGGDVISYDENPRRLEVNGELVEEPYIHNGVDRASPTLAGSDCKRLDMERVEDACRVPAGTVFVMGDNRGNSEDSRIIGPVDEDKIVGRAFLIIWPPSDLGTI